MKQFPEDFFSKILHKNTDFVDYFNLEKSVSLLNQ